MDPSRRTEHSKILFDTNNRIFLEIPKYKVKKDGTLGVHPKQKFTWGSDDAIRRILQTGQLLSSHGQACSLRRKEIIQAVRDYPNGPKLFDALTKANEVFFTTKWVDSKKTTEQYYCKSMREAVTGKFSPASTTDEFLMIAYRLRENQSSEAGYSFVQEQTFAAAEDLMRSGHGLKELTFKDLATIHDLIRVLRTHGPLMVTGPFGSDLYKQEKAVPLGLTVGEHAVYGWKKGTPQEENMYFLHAIILVGAEIKNQMEYVYWIDPAVEGNQIHLSTFKFITTHMAPLSGQPQEMIAPSAKPTTVYAVYNPKFAPQ